MDHSYQTLLFNESPTNIYILFRFELFKGAGKGAGILTRTCVPQLFTVLSPKGHISLLEISVLGNSLDTRYERAYIKYWLHIYCNNQFALIH